MIGHEDHVYRILSLNTVIICERIFWRCRISINRRRIWRALRSLHNHKIIPASDVDASDFSKSNVVFLECFEFYVTSCLLCNMVKWNMTSESIAQRGALSTEHSCSDVIFSCSTHRGIRMIQVPLLPSTNIQARYDVRCFHSGLQSKSFKFDKRSLMFWTNQYFSCL